MQAFERENRPQAERRFEKPMPKVALEQRFSFRVTRNGNDGWPR